MPAPSQRDRLASHRRSLCGETIARRPRLSMPSLGIANKPASKQLTNELFECATRPAINGATISACDSGTGRCTSFRVAHNNAPDTDANAYTNNDAAQIFNPPRLAARVAPARDSPEKALPHRGCYAIPPCPLLLLASDRRKPIRASYIRSSLDAARRARNTRLRLPRWDDSVSNPRPAGPIVTDRQVKCRVLRIGHHKWDDALPNTRGRSASVERNNWPSVVRVETSNL
jgi:hypothetical protein